MKLTKQTLKRIIKEELSAVMSEIYVRPMDLDPEIFSPEEIDNIHGMIATGDPGRRRPGTARCRAARPRRR